MKTLLHIGFCIGAIACMTGCMDGPFYAMKRINPYYQASWRGDRELGPTFEDRLEELELLKSQLPTMTVDRQVSWAEHLAGVIRDDASPELRARAVAVIATLPSEAAERALNSASADEVEKVRMAACSAWKNRGGEAARDMLLSMASTDESNSVRQSAVDSLRAFNEPEVLRALAVLLEDSSPAVQYQVAQSLATLTGEDYGGDLDAWTKYLNGPGTPIDTNGLGGPLVLPASGSMDAPIAQ